MATLPASAAIYIFMRTHSPCSGRAHTQLNQLVAAAAAAAEHAADHRKILIIANPPAHLCVLRRSVCYSKLTFSRRAIALSAAA